jgi:hypothetical protein
MQRIKTAGMWLVVGCVPNVGFSIAASVKLFLVTSCHIPSARRSALADVERA